MDALNFTKTVTRAVPHVDGRAPLKVERREGQDRLADLYMRDPLRVLFPRPQQDESFPAVLATASGGRTQRLRGGADMRLRPNADNC